MNVSYAIIGQNIRQARQAAKLTPQQAAERSELSASHYERIERGEHQVSLSQLARIGTALRTPFESLLVGCILNTENYGAALEMASNQPAGYAEYALMLTEQYRDQFKALAGEFRLKDVLH